MDIKPTASPLPLSSETSTTHSAASCCAADHAHNDTQQHPPAPSATAADAESHRYRISSMDCPTEESEIRLALESISELRSLRFDLSLRTLDMAGTPAAVAEAVLAMRRIGFDPQSVETATGTSADEPSSTAPDHATSTPTEGLARLLVALLLAVAAEVLGFLGPDTQALQIATMALALAAIGLAGLSTYKKGLSALRVGRLNINALMTVAVTGAFVIGQWPEAAMVMALYAIAELIEAKSVERARRAIKDLLALAPDDAEVLQPSGAWVRTATRAIAVGSIARIRPGERVPLDGVVTSGQSAIDQAPVTGESIPVDKGPGDPVYAGTVNQTAALEFRVTASATDSTLARIIHAVEQAQGSRAPTQRFVDRFAALYTPAVFVLALAVALLAPWWMGLTWLQAVYKALVLLVIACPCALVIATPVTVVSALAAAARRGILIKGGVFLEQARKIKAVALDKTGTLTEGKPRLVAFEVVSSQFPEDQLKRLAKSLASRSDHPVSKAITEGLDGEVIEVAGFSAAAGRGVQAQVYGLDLVLGNHRWVEERDQCSPDIEARLKVHEEAGRSVTMLTGPQGVLALCAVADTIKPTSTAAVAALKALGVTPVMLTGDNVATAQAIALQAGIAEVHGNLLPEEKLAVIKEMQFRLGVTAMTGDGINDAPALAQADIGFAMGGAGTHTAMEAADVVIMNDDLQRLPQTIQLSRRTHAVLWQNIVLALGIKAVFLVLAIAGDASMWMAVFADMGASLLVVFNGLRLLRA